MARVSTSLFEPVGDGSYQPTGLARGPWSPHALHGGPVSALVAHRAEEVLAATGAPAVEPVRLTASLDRPVPLAPLRVDASVVRPGKKVQVAAVQVHDADGNLLVRAEVLAIRRAEIPLPPTTQLPDDPAIAGPDAGEPEPPWRGFGDDVEVFHADGVEHRYVSGTFLRQGPATDWIRLRHPVLPGLEPSPFQRVVAAADFTNGVSGVLPFGEWRFINPDLTVTLHRTPVGERIGVDAVTRIDAASGIGTAEATLHDERGRIGRAVQTLLVEPVA